MKFASLPRSQLSNSLRSHTAYCTTENLCSFWGGSEGSGLENSDAQNRRGRDRVREMAILSILFMKNQLGNQKHLVWFKYLEMFKKRKKDLNQSLAASDPWCHVRRDYNWWTEVRKEGEEVGWCAWEAPRSTPGVWGRSKAYHLAFQCMT